MLTPCDMNASQTIMQVEDTIYRLPIEALASRSAMFQSLLRRRSSEPLIGSSDEHAICLDHAGRESFDYAPITKQEFEDLLAHIFGRHW